MKNCFLVVCLFIIPYTYSQKINKKTIESYLTKSKTSTDLEFLIEILKKENINYKIYTNNIPTINPLNPEKQKRVSRGFSLKKVYHPIDKNKKKHLGIDIVADLATPVYAPANGTVIKNVNSKYGYGNHIYIEHSYGYKTRYAHLFLSVVNKNDVVKKGDIIGFVGSTGKSTGYHLHYEILKNNKHLNPYPFLYYYY